MSTLFLKTVADNAYKNKSINKEMYERLKTEMKKNKVKEKERGGIGL